MKNKSALLTTWLIVALLLGVILYVGRVRASMDRAPENNHSTRTGAEVEKPLGAGNAVACSFSVTPASQSFPSAGGPGSGTVTVASGCTWTAVSTATWITITSGTAGSGSGTVSYTVSANSEVSSRTGALLIAGQFVLITQSGAGRSCPPTTLTIPQSVNGSLSASDCRSVIDDSTYADLYSFSALAGQRVAVALSSAQFDAFLTMIGPNGVVIAVNDDSNSSVSTDSRIPPGSDYFVLPADGVYVIDASSYNSGEVGNYTLSLTAPSGQSCTYAVASASQSFTASGGSGSANVTTTSGCGWTGSSSVSWIVISGGAISTGTGTLSFSVAANTSLGYRVGTVLVAGRALSIVQAGTGGNCPMTPLTVPQTVNDSWTPGGCVSSSGSLADLYSFSGQAGQQVAISLTTTNSFTSIYLYLTSGLILFSEGNGNLRLPSGSSFFVLPLTGTYIIEAGAGGAGSYALSLSAPAGSGECLTSPTGAITWLPGDGNANDVVGSNNGTPQNGATFATGLVGQAFSLDGVNDVVQVPNAASLNLSPTAPFSLELWAYRTGSNAIMHLVGKRTNCEPTAFNYQLALNTTTSEGLSFGGPAASGTVNTGANLPLNTWTHLAGTFDGTTLRLYINGQLAGSQTGTLGPTNTAPLMIGGSGTCQTFAGLLDEVSLYNRALSSSEIQSIFNAGSAGKCKTTPGVCSPIIGLNTNRLCNPGAELGSGGTSETQVVPIPGWVTTSNFTATVYGLPGGLPTLADSARIGGGTNFFTGGPSNASSTAAQTVDVTDEATGIDAGQRTAQLQAYLGGYEGDADNATVRAEYLNAQGSVIGTQLVVGPANGSLHLVSSSGAVPAGTRAIRVTLISTRLDGAYNDGYFDNVGLSLIQTGGANCPTITNLSPASGAIGSTVTITGTNFTGVTAVKFNSNVSASYTVVNATTITATVPNGAVSGPITISKTGCSDAQSAAFTVTTGTTGCSTPSFANAVTYATGIRPVGVAVKDFNGDTRPDLATSNYTSSNVAVLLANGTGGFNSATYVNAGSGPTAIESADFNGDSKFDLAVVNYNSNNVSILLGNGSGGFSPPTNYAVGTTPRNIVLADFNGDGKHDLAIANWDSNDVSVLLGNGSGGFTASATLSAGTDTVSVTSSDFNGDGKADIAASNGTSNNVSVFLGNGNGTFGAKNNYATGSFPFSITAADLNADGKFDLATANFNSGNISVLLGTGSGSFGAPVNYAVGDAPIFVTSSDLNLDGKPDLAAAVFGGSYIAIMLGVGNGTLGAPTNLTVGTNPNFVNTADLNGDTKPDLTVTNYESASVSVLLNTCTPQTCPSASGINPTSGSVGSTVTITGTNFSGVTAVRFSSNVSASFTVVNATTISATVPSGAVTGPITVSKTGCSDAQTATFTVSVAQCIAVSISTGLTGPSGGSLTVPITVSDTTGRGAIAYDFTVTFDATVLRLQATPYDRTGTLSAAMTVTANTSTSGQLVLSAFGASALTGSGTLLNLKFDVIGAGSSCSNLTWASFRFNEGTPCSTTTSGRVCAVGGSITGTVSYCVTPKPVPGVVVSAAGTPTATSTTTSAGVYQLTGLGAGPYTVTPTKTSDANGIASFDAALVAGHVVGPPSLSSCQLLAADTSGDGTISSFDAGLIAQFSVGIANAASKAGTWKFTPPSRSYASLGGDQTGQNFDAVLVGDVSGNWVAGASLADAQTRDELLTQQDVQVGLPELVAGTGTSLILPITVSDLTGRGVVSYDFDLTYNASFLESQAQPVDATGTLSSNFTITPNATAGRLRVSGFGTTPLSGSGVLLKLRFNVIGAVGNNTVLTWQSFQFNEGNPAAATVAGRVTIINIYTLSLTPGNQTVPLGSGASLTLISSVTQPVAVTYPVVSSNPAIATVPALVTIPANATMTTFAVTPLAVGGPATITAGYTALPGAPLATATVSVVRRVTCVSAATFQGAGLASESIVAGFGTSLATSTESAATVPLPTQLAGTTISVRDSLGVSRLSPLFFVSDAQVNFQIPAGTALGTATVTVTSGVGTVSSGAINIVRVAAGVFTANSDGSGVPAAYIVRVKPDGQQIAEDVFTYNQQTLRFVPREIDLTITGDRVFLILFGTGIRFYDSISNVVVRFGSQDQQVDAALPQGFFVGLDQVNVEMLRSKIPPGPVTATLRIEGIAARPVDLLVK